MDKFNSAVILAGGKSLRMEFDKQCLIIDNQRLIFKIAKILEKHFKDIIIVTNKKEYYKGCKYTLVSDKIQNKGPLSGISVGLGQSISDYVYIIACDMPNIDDSYISYMKEKINESIKNKENIDVYICKINDKIQPFQGFYKKDLEKEINKYLISESKKSIISFFENSNKKVKCIECDEFKYMNFKEDIFTNLNTKKDLNTYIKGL